MKEISSLQVLPGMQAGLVSQLGPSAGVTKIRKYSLELYKKLEQEDFSSGLKLNELNNSNYTR